MCGEDKVWVSTTQTKKTVEEMYVLKAHGWLSVCVLLGIKGATETGRGDVLEHMVNFEVSVFY